MKVVYSKRAVADIAAIFDYITQQDLATAMAVEADIRRAYEELLHLMLPEGVQCRRDCYHGGR